MSGTEKKNFQPVKVFIRQRPFTKNELEQKSQNIVHKLNPREIIVKSGHTEKKYNFDQVFGEEVSQTDVYNLVVSPLISYIISGYNCTVFAYGQTGTGKTHTIIGPNVISTGNLDENPSIGMIPRASVHLFTELSRLNPKIEYTVRVSFIEIYNEEVRDLLNKNTTLRIYDDPDNKGSVYIKGLQEVTVCTVQEVYEWLNIGITERQTAATNLNAYSSRSHTLFTFLINTREVTNGGEELIKTGKLRLVDLAGSENIGRSGATDVRLREAGTINKSLLTLGKVIKSLVQKVQHVPYRDSKLTRILQDSLGGNSKTCMVATFSPGANVWDETISTLEYAHMTRSVANCPQVNVNRQQANVLEKLQDEIGKLQQELSAARSGTGFYVSTGTYEQMSQDIERSKDKILELIGQIRDLEEYKKTREEQYKLLSTSFDQTKSYLETLQEELITKSQQVKQDEYILKYMNKRDEKLSETSSVLLNICETSTKGEEIYHSKYEGQCDATLANANIAKTMFLTSLNCFNEILNTSESFVKNQESHLSEVGQCVKFLKENSVQNLEQLAKSSLEMETEINLSLDKMVHNHTNNCSGNKFQPYFNTIDDNNSLYLENQRKFKTSIAALNNYISVKSAEMETKSAHCFNSVNEELAQKSDYLNKSKFLLQKMHIGINERRAEIHKQLARNKRTRSVLKEQLETTEMEANALTKELSAAKKYEEEMRQLIEKHENQNFSPIIRDALTDYVKCQTETVSAQISMVDDMLSDIDSSQRKLQDKAASDKSKIVQFLSEWNGTIKENLSQYNTELKNTVGNFMKKASAIKENLFKVTVESGERTDKSVRAICSSAANYNSDINKFIQQSSETLQDLKKDVIETTHVGDTPVKQTYQYPRMVEKAIPCEKLIEEFNKISEESAESNTE